MKRMLTFIVFTLLMLSAVSGGAKPQRQDTTEETHNFTRATETKSYDFVTEAATNTARLRVVVKLTTGRAEWKLLDPDGKAHLSGACAGGRVTTDTQDFKPAPTGGWKLQMELKDASGNYRINWETR
jgi:hypothetical protein